VLPSGSKRYEDGLSQIEYPPILVTTQRISHCILNQAGWKNWSKEMLDKQWLFLRFSEVSDLLKDRQKWPFDKLIILYSQKVRKENIWELILRWEKYLSATSTPKRCILWEQWYVFLNKATLTSGYNAFWNEIASCLIIQIIEWQGVCTSIYYLQKDAQIDDQFPVCNIESYKQVFQNHGINWCSSHWQISISILIIKMTFMITPPEVTSMYGFFGTALLIYTNGFS